MAKYRQTEGRRHIAGDGGYRWDPVDGAYMLDMPGLGTYTLEKRRRNPKDDTHTTGWYLCGDAAGSFFGEFCGTRILDAADEAGALIDREQRAAAPNELDDEDSWDEPRDDEDVLARNDDIAEAIRLAGFYVARRGVGQAVYASVERSGHVHGNGLCEVETHKGEPAPWVAVLSTGNPLEAPYACRDCVRRHVEGERAPEPAGLPQGDDPRTTELRRAGAALRRWIADERTDGPAAFAPNAVVRFGPELAAQLESMPAAEAGQSLVEAARMINDVEAGWPSTS